MKQHANQIKGWFKSTLCGASGGGCVEIAAFDGGVAVRDGKNPTGPALEFTAQEWRVFLAGVRAGEFDLGLD